MSKAVAWAVFALGIIHIVFGIIRFKVPLTEAWLAGFSGQFAEPEIRRTAFWFLFSGPLFILAGQLALHAIAMRDLHVLKLIGIYMLVVSVIGVIAFPRSPLWAPLALAPLMIAAGYGRLG